MGNAMRIARVSARGGFNLFWGLIVSNIISAVAAIIVARMLSPADYGLVKVASTAPGLFALFRDWGMNAAMVRYIAQYRSENNPSAVRNTILAGLGFMLSLGLILSLVSFLLSGFVAEQVFQRPEMAFPIRVTSSVIFAGALVSASESAFLGFETMGYRSVVLVSQALLKAVISPLLIFLGLGALGSILGNTLSALLAGVIGVSLLYFLLYKRLSVQAEGGLGLSAATVVMLRFGLPLFVSSIVGGFLTQFNNFLTAVYCSDEAIGNYSVALNFTVLISFFSQPIASVLFPAFSKISSEEDGQDLATVFRLSVKYAALLVVPVATAIMVLSPQVVFTLFGMKYGDAPLYLALLCLGSFYTALGNLSVGSFINSRGRTSLNMKLGVLNSLVGFPLSLVLVSRFQILGLIFASLISAVPGLLLGLWLIRRYWGVTIDMRASGRTLAASAIAALATYALVGTIVLPYWMLLFVGALLFLAVYFAAAPLVGAVTGEDLDNLEEMLKEFGPLQSLLKRPIDLMDRLARREGR